MPRQKFEHDLQELRGKLLRLGTLVERAVLDSVNALVHGDLPLARALVDADRAINEQRFALEAEALTLIATQQPVAGDLRALAAVFEIATELERIGDYAKGIATITLVIHPDERPLPPIASEFPDMAGLACGMLHRSLEACLRSDAVAARAIPEEDGKVDAMYDRIYRGLVAHLMTAPQEGGAATDQAVRLTWVAHNLERVADRVSNICERVIFTVAGTVEELTDDSGLRRPPG